MRKKIITITIIILGIILAIFIGKKLYDNYYKSRLTNKSWLNKHVSLTLNEEGIYEVTTSEDISIFNLTYQEVIEDKIDVLKESDDYSLDKPLIIYNPYGTGNSSYYIYLGKEYDNLSYKIETDGYDNYEVDLDKNDEYQLVGFIPGKLNTLTLTTDDDIYSVDITVPELEDNVDIKLKSKNGESNEKLSNGLYAVLGHDKNYASNIYLYDNSGVLRNELVLDSYRADRIIFDEDDMYYPYSKKGIMKVNRLGKIEKIYNLGNYSMHHDMVLDNDKLTVLVNEDNADTIEDIVITLDLKTGDITKVLDMKDVLKDLYKLAVNPGKNSYGGKALDWIHLNSISIKDDDIILSSRETSTIIYITDYQTNPEVKYLLTDESMLENTSYSDLLLNKKNEFTSQAGQHCVTYIEGEDDEYYLIMFNNNFGDISTRPDFKWTNYPGVGTYSKGETSYFYKYKINEEDKTYELVNSIKVPYSSIVSSVQYVDDNIVVGSGKDNSFEEYDADGTLIKQFNYSAKKYAYRVFKYSFDNWK